MKVKILLENQESKTKGGARLSNMRPSFLIDYIYRRRGTMTVIKGASKRKQKYHFDPLFWVTVSLAIHFGGNQFNL